MNRAAILLELPEDANLKDILIHVEVRKEKQNGTLIFSNLINSGYLTLEEISVKELDKVLKSKWQDKDVDAYSFAGNILSYKVDED